MIKNKTGKSEFSYEWFYFSLTIADTILIIDIVWQKSIVQHFMNPQEPEWYEKTYPFIWHPLKGILLSGTIFMTLAVSTERFRSFCSPMEPKIVSIFWFLKLFFQ